MWGLKLLQSSNYKIFSGKYIIFDSNGNGKEYDGYEDNLIFIGEYKNGERNGKGREYYDGTTLFEGEYLNGVKNGIGREYDISNNLKFEGEYSKGEKNGTGREYYRDGNLKFEGEYSKGKKNKIEKEKNMIMMVKLNLKVNISMEWNGLKKKNII